MTTRTIFSTLLITAILFAFSACSENEPSVPVIDVTLNESTLTLVVGETETLIATVTPDNADNQTVTWRSNNNAVATVSNAGVVTAVSAGTATITAQAGGKTATCTVIVKDGVRIADVIWATRNVDAPGTFADNPQDFGMFFQWNRRQAWAGTGYEFPNPMPGWDSSTPEGTAWYAENDPCPEGWRVPTQQELQSLSSVGSTWEVNWNYTGINVRVFGTVPNQIFLPAAGDREPTAGMQLFRGTFGAYWSSTASGDGNAFHLQAGGGVNVTARNRVNGHLVRCVAE